MLEIVKFNLLLDLSYDRIPVALHDYGGYSVGVNTSGCGPEDRGFKSHYSPKADGFFVSLFSSSALSSTDRASVFETECWGFESLRAYFLILTQY